MRYAMIYVEGKYKGRMPLLDFPVFQESFHTRLIRRDADGSKHYEAVWRGVDDLMPSRSRRAAAN